MKSSNLLFLVVLSTFYLNVSGAQGKLDVPSAISIKIQTSKAQPAVGSGLGVMAEIKNVSNTIVSLHAKSLTLTLPPELEGPFQPSWAEYALFPTEMETPKDYYDAYIRLQPGDTYKVFWSPGRGEKTSDTPSFSPIITLVKTITSELRFLLFSPGEYTLTVNAKYWLEPNNNYHTVTESTTLPFAAPESVILVGAAFGGLIAFYLFPQARRRFVMRKKPREDSLMAFVLFVVKEVTGITGSILLSVVVTILLSRISETQFLIKVTITDFWGAIAIGFVANYSGAKILDRWPPQGTSSSVQVGSPTPSAEAAATAGEKVLSNEEKHEDREGK